LRSGEDFRGNWRNVFTHSSWVQIVHLLFCFSIAFFVFAI
jgi:ABC-type transport system involved in multi-copper enzyme maturation permease subunit